MFFGEKARGIGKKFGPDLARRCPPRNGCLGHGLPCRWLTSFSKAESMLSSGASTPALPLAVASTAYLHLGCTAHATSIPTPPPSHRPAQASLTVSRPLERATLPTCPGVRLGACCGVQACNWSRLKAVKAPEETGLFWPISPNSDPNCHHISNMLDHPSLKIVGRLRWEMFVSRRSQIWYDPCAIEGRPPAPTGADLPETIPLCSPGR